MRNSLGKKVDAGLLVEVALPGRFEVSRAVITLERGDISPSLNITCLHAKRGENPVSEEERKSGRTQTGYANPSSNQILFRHRPTLFPACRYKFHPSQRPKRRRVSPQAD